MPRTPKEYPVLDALRERLGTVPDKDIADETGLSPSIVGRYRRRHGIAAYQGYKFGHDEEGSTEAVVGLSLAPAPAPKASSPAPAPAPAPAPSAASHGAASRSSTPSSSCSEKVPDAEVAELRG